LTILRARFHRRGIHGRCHLPVFLVIFQELHHAFDDVRGLRAHRADGSGGDPFRPFRGLTQDEHGLAQTGTFLLQAAGIGQNQVGSLMS
jgi:hypothetical protein